jgi:NTE family protein
MQHAVRALVALCIVAIVAPSASGQTAPTASASVAPNAADATTLPRPRIGLVLSGGGARGLTHIGVLQVLEKMRIPVDYIAATSMGAIVGGLYASGMSPAEMQKQLAGVSWPTLLSSWYLFLGRP